MKFVCNICSGRVEGLYLEQLEREGGWCSHCGATVRQRSLVHLLSISFFNRSLPIAGWPERKDIRGIGISDWHRFAEFFAGKVSYCNTYYDRTPFLDVRNPARHWQTSADFVICSDVLEHVSPPPQLGFNGICRILKPGGTVVFTVPYGLERTKEHYPQLYHWSLDNDGPSVRLTNTTRGGELQTFKDLIFHGGSGQVLEMRLFGLKDIARHVETAGLVGLSIMDKDVLEYGIHFKEPWSRSMTAKRPMFS